MARTTKKGSNNKKATLRRPVVKTSVAEQAQTIAELRQQLAESLQRENATAKELKDCKRQLTEALEQQTATSEVLRRDRQSPTDIQPVLDAGRREAAQLCERDDAHIRVEGDVLRIASPLRSRSHDAADDVPLDREYRGRPSCYSTGRRFMSTTSGSRA